MSECDTCKEYNGCFISKDARLMVLIDLLGERIAKTSPLFQEEEDLVAHLFDAIVKHRKAMGESGRSAAYNEP